MCVVSNWYRHGHLLLSTMPLLLFFTPSVSSGSDSASPLSSFVLLYRSVSSSGSSTTYVVMLSSSAFHQTNMKSFLVASSCASLAIVSLSYAIILCFTWQCTLLLFCAVYNKTSCTFVMLLHCTAILYFSQNSFFCTSCILLFCTSHKMASCTTCIYSHYM